MPYQPDKPSARGLLGLLLALPLLIVLVPIMLVVIPILNLFGLNKSGAGPEYVADYLERFIQGSEGERDWDDFCSVPLKDERLDAVRETVCRFAPPGEMSVSDREELKRLLAELQPHRELLSTSQLGPGLRRRGE